ncbi:hypothetical protein HK099_006200 [Clydaea vesicula]|uniref:Nuclear condensin complex subunit 3 C-terminal domain-containing protein n=1 Tax=Clydaea vesicula TaxID=447962 RepID=A0AAD5U668_9FUNG|nr:hypothetical protein HK099_006200 [Clydaea vesicula]
MVHLTTSEIFNQTLRATKAQLKKLTLKLTENFKNSKTQTKQEIKHSLYKILTIKKGVKEAEKILNFFNTFLITLGSESSDFGEDIVRELLAGVNAKDKTVRYRILQIFEVVIRNLPELSDDIYLGIRTSALKRSNDKEISVRIIAINLLCFYFQDTGDEEEDSLTKARLLEILDFDPSPEVRMLVISNIEINAETMPTLVLKSREVEKKVRKILYVELGKKEKNLEKFVTVQQKEFLFNNGLQDRAADVQNECLKCMCKKFCANFDYYGLLQFITLDNPEIAETALIFFLKESNWKSNIDIGEECNNNEFYSETRKWFFTRVYLEFLAKNKHEQYLEKSLPTVPYLIQQLSSHFQILRELPVTDDEESDDVVKTNEFCILEILKICKLHDFIDEFGRRMFLDFLRSGSFEVNIENEKCLSLIITLIKNLSTSEQDFTSIMVEVLHYIRDSEVEIIKETQEFSNYNDNDIEISSDGLYDCLRVVVYVLQNVEKAFALKYSPYFFQFSQSGEYSLELKALEVLLDLIMFYGIKLFNCEESSVSLLQILNLLKIKLKSDKKSMLCLTVEGLTKIYLSNLKQFYNLDHTKEEEKYLIEESLQELLKSFIQLYFSSLTEKFFPKLKQCLSYFFSVFPYTGEANQLLISKVFVESLKIALAAPDQQSISEQKIGQLLVEWTDVRKLVKTEKNLPCNHFLVADDIAEEILRNPDDSKILFQLLGMLNFTNDFENKQAKDEYLNKIDKMRLVLNDSISLTGLKK